MIKHFNNREHLFLSNFFRACFEVNGVLYKTVEHYFQSQKTLDPIESCNIRNASTAKEAKELGRIIELRHDWEEVKVDIMRIGVLAKFSQNCTLKQRLIDTGDEEIQEGNCWGDTFWGVDENGQGSNWLGRILMEVREKLKQDIYTKLKP